LKLNAREGRGGKRLRQLSRENSCRTAVPTAATLSGRQRGHCSADLRPLLRSGVINRFGDRVGSPAAGGEEIRAKALRLGDRSAAVTGWCSMPRAASRLRESDHDDVIRSLQSRRGRWRADELQSFQERTNRAPREHTTAGGEGEHARLWWN